MGNQFINKDNQIVNKVEILEPCEANHFWTKSSVNSKIINKRYAQYYFKLKAHFLRGILSGDSFGGFLLGIPFGGFLWWISLMDSFRGFLRGIILGYSYVGFLRGMPLRDSSVGFLWGIPLGDSFKGFHLGFFPEIPLGDPLGFPIRKYRNKSYKYLFSFFILQVNNDLVSIPIP